ncbi:MAG: hypothetical protein XXXJIFNMEKO3_01749 [Candidatus Erwinia impunctatus]|nr:hypothetical protein XXXJIFNMEKO_01749 [Culicoides impunctatus]
MGLHFLTPASAGIRQRDDYGAQQANHFPLSCLSSLYLSEKKHCRMTRSFPVVHSGKSAAVGRLNNVH